MGLLAGREEVRCIDRDRKVVKFDSDAWHGKITGSRFLAVLGKDDYMSDFKAACLIARLCYDDTKSIQTEAGEKIEPILRSYIRENRDTILRDRLHLDGGEIRVEEPVAKNDCGFDHFKRAKVFGGLVDGFIDHNGKRYAILEIKTTGDRSKWFDENGENIIPEGYELQASLYAELSKLDKIVFGVAFLEQADYDDPEAFVPTEDNTLFLAVDKKDISEEMRVAEEWYHKYIDAGITPEWGEKDAELVDFLTSLRITDMPGEAQMLFKKYIKYMDSEEDLSDLEYTLSDILMSKAVDGVRKVVHQQNGVTFTLSLDNMRMTVTRD